MYCPHCVQIIPDGAAKCPVCGKDTGVQNKENALPIGSILANRYYVGAILGQGGFGITYVGCDTRLNKRIAIKEYYPSNFVNRISTHSPNLTVTAGDEKDVYEHERQKFIKEAYLLAEFSGDRNVVNVSDILVEHNTAYIIMDFVEGETLDSYIGRRGRMTADEAFRLLSPMIDSLGRIHSKGLIHRDISPANIMVQADGHVTLLDFGAAREFDNSEEKSISVILKHGYAPTEQYQSRGPQGPWTDVYALCATMYKMITGITPPSAVDRMVGGIMKRPSELGAYISPAQEEVLMKGMALAQGERYSSMTDLSSAWRQAAVSGPSYQIQEPVTPVMPNQKTAVHTATEVLVPSGSEKKQTAYTATEIIMPDDGAQVTPPENEIPVEVPKQEEPKQEEPKQDEPKQEEAPAEPVMRENKIGGRLVVALVAILALIFFIFIVTSRSQNHIGSETGNKQADQSDRSATVAQEQIETAAAAGNEPAADVSADPDGADDPDAVFKGGQEGSADRSDGMIKVGIIMPDPNASGYLTALHSDLVVTFSEENNYDEMIFRSMNNDEMIAEATKMLDSGIDYLLLDALIRDGWEIVLQKAADMGVKVITFDSFPGFDPRFYEAAVVNDMQQQGQTAVNWLLAQRYPEYNVLLLQGARGSNAQLGRSNPLEWMDDQYDECSIVYESFADWDESNAYQAVLDAVNQGIQFNVIYSENDGMTYGAVRALDESGITYGPYGDVTIISFDCSRWGLEEVYQKRWNLNVQCSPFQASSIDTVIRELEQGRQIPDKTVIVEDRAFDAWTIQESDVENYGL